ncbi:hypothetical protein HPB49_005854 [Dermacentor silvarum]|uniref:Uncharacterized protein n=1 Tax=Dermacentor silvarum TaxID=543639 RepID=A0ACB8CVN0_DERSI|nr:hypothetical protein HPB49_005854 [Dermacentor silvarum]
MHCSSTSVSATRERLFANAGFSSLHDEDYLYPDWAFQYPEWHLCGEELPTWASRSCFTMDLNSLHDQTTVFKHCQCSPLRICWRSNRPIGKERFEAARQATPARRTYLLASTAKLSQPAPFVELWSQCLNSTNSICGPAVDGAELGAFGVAPVSWYERLLVWLLSLGPVPRAIGVIPDGNRRFARKRGVTVDQGHVAGSHALGRVGTWCSLVGVKESIVYVFSVDNFRRPRSEQDGLFQEISRRCQYILDNS